MSVDKKAASNRKKKGKVIYKDDELAASCIAAQSSIKRSGYLETKNEREPWKVMYCILVEGSLFLYKNSTDPEHTTHVPLKGLTFDDTVEVDRKYSFSLTKGSEFVLLGSVAGSVDLEQWKKDLLVAFTLEEADAPTSSATRAKKSSLADRAKKNLASKAAGSSAGQKAVKKSNIINEESLNALKALIKANSTQKKAEDMEKSIITVCVKAFLLIENRTLRAEEFLPADKLLRASFDLLVKIYHGKSRVQNPKIILTALQRVESSLKDVEKVLLELLGPHLQAKNKYKIVTIFGEIANKDFLFNILNDNSSKPHLEHLVTSMEYYTQFS